MWSFVETMLLDVSPYLYATIGSSSALALSVLGAAWFVLFFHTHFLSNNLFKQHTFSWILFLNIH